MSGMISSVKAYTHILSICWYRNKKLFNNQQKALTVMMSRSETENQLKGWDTFNFRLLCLKFYQVDILLKIEMKKRKEGKKKRICYWN